MNEPWWIALIEAFLIINLLLLTFAYTTWLERKVLGRLQQRYGPNRAGPFGVVEGDHQVHPVGGTGHLRDAVQAAVAAHDDEIPRSRRQRDRVADPPAHRLTLQHPVRGPAEDT